MDVPSAAFYKFLVLFFSFLDLCWGFRPTQIGGSDTRDPLPDLWGNVGGVKLIPRPGDKYD